MYDNTSAQQKKDTGEEECENQDFSKVQQTLATICNKDNKIRRKSQVPWSDMKYRQKQQKISKNQWKR